MTNPKTIATTQTLRPLTRALFPALIPGAGLLLFFLLRDDRALMTAFTRRITSPLKFACSAFWQLLPFGMAEVVWAAAIAGGLIFAGRTVRLLVRGPHRLRIALRRLWAALCIALWIAFGYTALWGVNYYADGFCAQTGLADRGCAPQELHTLLVAFHDRASALADEMPRDENGLFCADAAALLRAAPDAYAPLTARFPCLDGPRRTPKGMIFSVIMSHLGFTGFYFPFTGESLVNIDQPRYIVPVTALHELSHQRNIAPEEECNFLAILAGLESGDPLFEYSACMFAAIHLSNALWRADRNLHADAETHLSDIARRDDWANTAYWNRFQTPVQDVGTVVYEGFLQSYGQTEGMASYGKCVDLLVAYYFDYAPEQRFW